MPRFDPTPGLPLGGPGWRRSLCDGKCAETTATHDPQIFAHLGSHLPCNCGGSEAFAAAVFLEERERGGQRETGRGDEWVKWGKGEAGTWRAGRKGRGGATYRQC
eukprot:2188564-Rhodomonas_salina.1